MAVYVVSYDLRKPGRDYKGLSEALQSSPGWWHYLESTWLIVTSEGAGELYDRLAPHLDRGDSILVIQAGSGRQGWLPEDAWKWIQQNLR